MAIVTKTTFFVNGMLGIYLNDNGFRLLWWKIENFLLCCTKFGSLFVMLLLLLLHTSNRILTKCFQRHNDLIMSSVKLQFILIITVLISLYMCVEICDNFNARLLFIHTSSMEIKLFSTYMAIYWFYLYLLYDIWLWNVNL